MLSDEFRCHRLYSVVHLLLPKTSSVFQFWFSEMLTIWQHFSPLSFHVMCLWVVQQLGPVFSHLFSHIYKQERAAVHCWAVLFIGVQIAGQHRAEVSGSLRQSAGWPKPSQGPSSLG